MKGFNNLLTIISSLFCIGIFVIIFGGIFILKNEFGEYYSQIKNKIYPENNYVRGLSVDGLKQLNQSLNIFNENVLILDRYANDLQKRTIITMRDLYEEIYKEWKEFVNKVHGVSEEWKSVSFKLRTCKENTNFLINEIIDTFTKRPEDDNASYDGRVKTAIRFLSSEFKILSEDWKNLHTAF